MLAQGKVYPIPRFLYAIAKRAAIKDDPIMHPFDFFYFAYDIKAGFKGNEPSLPKAILGDVKLITAWCVLVANVQNFEVQICFKNPDCEIRGPHAHIEKV